MSSDARPLGDAPELLTAAEVARRLRLAVPTVYQRGREAPGQYGAVRLGRRAIRFKRAAIDALIEGEGDR